MDSMCVRVCNTYFFIWIYKGFIPTLRQLIYIPVLQLAVSLLYVISNISSVRSVTYRSGFFVKKVDGHIVLKIFFPFRILKAKNTNLC